MCLYGYVNVCVQVYNTYAFPPDAGNRQWAGTTTTFGLCCPTGQVNVAGICCASGQINVNMQCASTSLKPNVGLFYQVRWGFRKFVGSERFCRSCSSGSLY